MKRVLAGFVICVILLVGCGKVGAGRSEAARSEISEHTVISQNSETEQSRVFESAVSGLPVAPKDISLLAGLPHTADGQIDFKTIAFGYNLVYSWDVNFNGDFDYKRAFHVMDCFGVYDFTEYVKSQIKPYFDEDEWCITLPADAVDQYVLSKFNVTVDRSLIEEYDPKTETYLIYPFEGEYYYETEVLSSKALENG